MSNPDLPLRGPITGEEPLFLRELPMDNAVGAIVALSAELWMLRERLATLEAELANRNLVPAGAVERHERSPAEQQERAQELAAFTRRVLSELSRDRTPVSRIDPRVSRYLSPHDSSSTDSTKK